MGRSSLKGLHESFGTWRFRGIWRAETAVAAAIKQTPFVVILMDDGESVK